MFSESGLRADERFVSVAAIPTRWLCGPDADARVHFAGLGIMTEFLKLSDLMYKNKKRTQRGKSLLKLLHATQIG